MAIKLTVLESGTSNSKEGLVCPECGEDITGNITKQPDGSLLIICSNCRALLKGE